MRVAVVDCELDNAAFGIDVVECDHGCVSELMIAEANAPDTNPAKNEMAITQRISLIFMAIIQQEPSEEYLGLTLQGIIMSFPGPLVDYTGPIDLGGSFERPGNL